MIVRVDLGERGYDIVVLRGAIAQADKYFDLCRRALIVTDDGVPEKYAKAVAAKCKDAKIFTFPQGEASKNADTYLSILKAALDFDLSRADCIVAVGGGVVGDISGFAAATYMRGIDFYNVPTTLLSQVDSSIGGKTAIDFCGIKNIVGAFYQPKAVLIDPDTLDTLPRRQISNGMAEAIKMAATSDAELFGLIERGCDTEQIISGSIRIKRDVVQADEREAGLRRVLNFGHTIGHGIEAAAGGSLYHGECVAAGMIPMCSDAARARLMPVLERYDLPTSCAVGSEKIMQAMIHDKKAEGGAINVVLLDDIGSFTITKQTPQGIMSRIKAAWGDI
ncbi:MAG: 3-dehydroquinate synthase [Clostridia bacterium]|nr:3-dehydroquinate synthase [Clostridia bacterium]